MLDFTRHSTLIPPEIADLSTTIIGVGSIGSHVAETLAKTGISILHVWDDDIVEPHNLPNQGYYLGDLGKPKVEALRDRLEAGTGITVTPHQQRYTEGDFGTTLVVTGLDSMAARKAVYRGWLKDPVAKLLIDGRMGSRFGKVFFVDKDQPESMEAYVASLHSDEESYVEPCTARSTIFCAYGIAGLMCGALISWVINEDVPYQVAADFVNLRTIPFAR